MDRTRCVCSTGVEVSGADPFERRLPALLLPHVNLFDEGQARQDVGYVIEAPHLS